MNNPNKNKFRSYTGLLFALLLIVSLIFVLSGCGQQTASEPVPTRIFTDSSGREVEVPVNIERVAVSGPLAQMHIFAISPDLLCGLSGSWSDEAKKYIDEKYYDLPVLGQLYGSKGDLNKETIMSTGAQIIIDVGESKDSIAEDMDDIQTQTGIPTVHIASYLGTAQDAFRMLGDLLGRKEEGEELAQFCERAYMLAEETASAAEPVDLLYLDGDLGLNVLAKGSYHSEVIDMLSNNLAVIDNPSGKGLGNEIDMEQLLKWDPECIIFAPQSMYKYVEEEAEWQNIKAIKNGNYYEVPYGPYNWMGSPPGCQRYIGMLWMAKLLYPDQADFDLYEECMEFYRLFVHTDLTQDMYNELVKNSVLK